MSIFFILTASKNIKFQTVKFEVGFSYKDCIYQFLLLKNYRLWSFICFIPTNLESIIFD